MAHARVIFAGSLWHRRRGNTFPSMDWRQSEVAGVRAATPAEPARAASRKFRSANPCSATYMLTDVSPVGKPRADDWYPH